jgi:hypothetical protein
VKRNGPANDLIELTELQVPLAEIGVGPVDRNGASREGALPASARALDDSLHQLAFLRPYVTTEGVTGWFDDFGHSGFPDAIGGIGRVGLTLNPFTVGLPPLPGNLLDLTPLDDNIPALEALGFSLNNLRRCPGAHERGLTNDQLTIGGTVDCDTSQVPIGP